MKKKSFLGRVFNGMLASMVGVMCVPASTSLEVTAADQCDQGTQDGLDWELWNQNYQGTSKMTLTGNGGFIAEWSGIENYLARTGKKWASNSPTWESVGDIKLSYDADYRPNGNSYLAVYGWTRNSLVEYYIIENFGTWRPPGGQGQVGTITVNGHIYDVYKAMRYNQPSIDGTATFPQYFSVRRDGDKSSKGVIDISEHFKQWEKLGLDMGSQLYEVSLVVEGYQSSGYAEVKQNYITLGGKPLNAKGGQHNDGSISDDPGTTTPTIPSEPTVDPDANGYYFHNTFESSTEDWEARGSSSVAQTTKQAYAGKGSLYVTDRAETWNGAAIPLDSSAFVPGKTYSFSAMAMQNSLASEPLKLTLQYTDSTGTEQYDTVAEADGSKGVWTKLENTKYTIPSGASNLLLYVETANELVNFFVDEAFGAVEGTSQTVKSKLGDVNADGKIDIADAVALNAYLLGKDSDITAEAADITADNELDVFDLTALKILVVNYVEPEPEPEPEPITTTTAPQQQTTPPTSGLDPSKPMVAISFDDGAVGTAANSTSMRILNALNKSGFRSTFFYVGDWTNASNQGEIVTAHGMGMEIANHTKSHPYLTQKSANEIRYEYDSCADKLRGIIGTEPSKLLRLPYLASNSTVQQTLYDAPLITCYMDTEDWNNASSDQIINKIKGGIQNGSLKNKIVLAHETYGSTAQAMEYLCPYLKEQGWQIVTISEMYAAGGKQLTGGQIHTGF